MLQRQRRLKVSVKERLSPEMPASDGKNFRAGAGFRRAALQLPSAAS